MKSSSSDPWPWLPMLLRRLKGSYAYEAHEPVRDRSWLMKCSYPDFDIVAYYEISVYRRLYERWFVPNATKHVASVFVETNGNVPESFKKALSRPFHFPVAGYNGALSENHFYEMCMTFNDILTARLRSFIKSNV